MLAAAQEAAEGLDVTLLYYSTVAPFDAAALRDHRSSRKVLLCEPYYRGGLAAEITEALWPEPVLLRCLGVPRRFLDNYGRMAEHDAALGLTAAALRRELKVLIDA
jgi:transketolase